MITLKESTSLQEIKFIPTRWEESNYLTIRNETTNEVVSKQINCSKAGMYLTFKTKFDLKQGHFYTIDIKYYGIINNKRDYYLVSRLKAFCTNQNVEDYSVNSGEYVENKQNIIFYE